MAIITLFSIGCEKSNLFNYREKLLISVEWGAEAGKFGLAVPAEGEIVGPRTFAIDDDGNIHVFDSIKRNIKVFNKEGLFQGSVGKELPGYALVVYQGNYYLLDGEAVHRYTFQGSPVETYPIAGTLTLYEGYGQGMRIVGKGDLYVRSQGRSYRICEGIGKSRTILSEEAQIKSERRGSPDSSGTQWFLVVKEGVNRFRLRIQDQGGSLVNEFPIETMDTFGAVAFLDRDERGTIYIETQRIGQDGTVHHEIRRYQSNGRLVQIVELPNDYYTIVYKKVVVDKKGVLYQLQTTQPGIRIVKWEP